MSRIVQYVRWIGHDAGGICPPQDVCAGVLGDVFRALSAGITPRADEVVVVVPPQWIGDWEGGHRLAPVYQHVWCAPRVALHPLPARPDDLPYRPATLPESAIGPRAFSPNRAPRGRRRRSERAV